MRFGPAIRLIRALIPVLALVALASVAPADTAGHARYLSSFHWTFSKPWFGGWSGIELAEDGRQMTVISDRGRILGAEITRKGDQITAVTPRRMQRLKASDGKFLTSKIGDSEGLVVAPDGSVYVSFEGVSRLSRYSRPAAAARALRRHETFRDLPKNKSLEALAMDRVGRIYTIPEQLDHDGRIRVFVLDNDTWTTPFRLPGRGGFLPVGADFGPDGRLYLLERAWSVFGFRTRVRVWDLEGKQPVNEQVLVQTRTGTHDNLEGLAVWRDKQGRTRLTMVSDDNFMWFQRTELVEYVLQE